MLYRAQDLTYCLEGKIITGKWLWNLKCKKSGVLYRPGSLTTLVQELVKHKLDFAGSTIGQMGKVLHCTSKQLYIVIWQAELDSSIMDGILCS